MKSFIKQISLLCFLLCVSFSTNIVHSQITTNELFYSTRIQEEGWVREVTSGKISGTVGQSKPIKALQVRLLDSSEESHIEYSTYIQDTEWLDYVSDGKISASSDENKHIEALRIRLRGPIEKDYDVYYRTHISDFGWLGWAKNDEISGTTHYNRPVEALQILLIQKGEKAPGPTGNASMQKEELLSGKTGLDELTGIESQGYVESLAWLDPVYNQSTIGTVGQSINLEKFKVHLNNLNGSIHYNSYLSEEGWQEPSQDGQESGKSGVGRHIEAFRVSLTGDVANQFDVYYRAHVSNLGWLGWACNGQNAGTREANLPVQAIEICLVHKELPAPGSMEESFIDYETYYQHHQKMPAIPGKRTIKHFLGLGLQAVGQTNYILGGGRLNQQSPPVAGPSAVTIGVYPQWKKFFDLQDATYDYTQHYYEFLNGLDCSGFVGWTVYNTLNTKSGGSGEVNWSYAEPEWYASKGYGQYQPKGSVKDYSPGDIVCIRSPEDHVYIVIGKCSDGSVVLMHSSPPGVMLSGTTPKIGQQTEATRLAHKYMKRYYPEYYKRYSNQLDRLDSYYLKDTAKFSWSASCVKDPDNMRNKSAEEVLKVLFNDLA